MALLAYIAAGIFARPELGEVLRYTIIPTIRFDSRFLAVIVALLGQALTPYMFFWQTDEEAEEKKAHMSRRRLWRRRPNATNAELEFAFWDVSIGMLLANLIMYFITLSTGATLFKAGQTQIQSAADAAQALRPVAGGAATAP